MEIAEMEAREFAHLMFEAMKLVVKEVKKYGIENLEMNAVTKTNLGQVAGITARFTDGSNTAPTVYPSAFYEAYKSGASIEELAEKAVETLKAGHDNLPQFDPEAINAENAPDHLYMVLINKEMNAEIATKCPHFEMEDLIAVPRWRVSQSDGETASILVTHDIQTRMLHMTDEEVCSIAKAASIEEGFIVKGMNEVMMEMMGQDVPEEFLAEMFPAEEIMYVVTNEQKMNGAIALLDKATLESVKEKIGEETFFVIPSSVHEVLVIPASKVSDPADLKEMCESVNATEVSVQDKLGDNIYRYDGKKLLICNSIEDLQKQTANISAAITEGAHIGRRM